MNFVGYLNFLKCELCENVNFVENSLKKCAFIQNVNCMNFVGNLNFLKCELCENVENVNFEKK